MSVYPHVSDIVSDIQSAAARLYPFFPLFPLPDHLDEDTRKAADAALDGIVIVQYLGEHRLPLGRHHIDWMNPSFHSYARHDVYATSFIGQLATAYSVLGEERYAEAARDYLAEYMSAWPTDTIGRNNDVDSTLILSGRNVGWAQHLHRLIPSPAFDAEFVARVVAFSAAQFQYLRDHMTSAINWRIFCARGLLTGSLYLAFLDPAADWQRYAVRVLNDAWFRQFLPDGVHCERVPTYHAGMAGVFRNLYRLGRLLPELGLIMSVDRLIPMYDFVLACAKPNGYLCGIHDSQSAFTGHVRDGVYTHTSVHKSQDHNKIWEEFRREFDLPLERPATSQVFPHAALAFLRTGWDEDAAWMSFDATNWGSGHCHLSRNAVQLHAFRQSMVIDPGWLDYEENAWGLYGHSTRAHSTCNLHGLNQSSTDPCRFASYGAPGYDAVFSVYEGGYWNTNPTWTFTHATDGIWAQHARLLFWVQDRFAFVADSMFRLHWADGTEDAVYWGCNFGMMLGSQPDFETDSSLVHVRKDAAGRITGGCCVHGTYIAPFSTATRQKPETFRF